MRPENKTFAKAQLLHLTPHNDTIQSWDSPVTE